MCDTCTCPKIAFEMPFEKKKYLLPFKKEEGALNQFPKSSSTLWKQDTIWCQYRFPDKVKMTY